MLLHLFWSLYCQLFTVFYVIQYDLKRYRNNFFVKCGEVNTVLYVLRLQATFEVFMMAFSVMKLSHWVKSSKLVVTFTNFE